MHHKKAFTLIELLVVIFVIGIISAIIYVGLNRAQMEARDSVRKADVDSYAKALMVERTIGSEEFPREEAICCLDANEGDPLYCSNARNSQKVKEVLTAIPTDPLHNGTTDHCYRYISNGSSATISVPLEKGEIYTYTLGDRPLTETTSSALNLTVISEPPRIGGTWARGAESGDRSLVRRAIGVAPQTRTEGDEVYSGTAISFDDDGLSYDTEYCYSLWNYNSFDDLYSKSTSSCATTAPSPVSSLSAIPVNGSSIDLSWIKSKPGYDTIIRRSTSSSPQSVDQGDPAYLGSGLNSTDSGLSSGTTYYYSAFSYNAVTDIYSTPISSSATTAPAAPDVVIGTTGYDSISVAFTMPSSADSVYIRYVKGSTAPASRSDGLEIGNRTSSPYTHSGLDSDSTYCYSVWSYDSINSLYSDNPSTGCATTLIPTPAVPSLSVSAASSSSITVTYNLPANAARTEIQRINPANSWSQTSGTSLTDSGLTPVTEYCYRARSCNSQDACSSYTANQCATTLIPTPAVPSLSVSAASSSSITVTYNLPANAARTEIQRINPANSWSQTSGTSLTDSGLTPVTEYCYRARSCNSQDACSSYTANQCATTLIPTPAVPSLSVSAASSSSITVTYNLPANAARTEIQRINPANSWSQTSGTSLTDSGLTPVTEYCYRARSCNSQDACSSYTANQCATTQSAIPAAPTTLTCTTVSGTQIDCSWSSTTGATSYQLQRNSTTVYDNTGTSYSNTGLSCGTSYSFQVRACNAYGCSGWKTASASTTVCVPAIPSTLSCNAVSTSQANCSWSGVSGATSYRLDNGGSTVYTGGSTSYSNTGLSCGTTYYYYVMACNSGGCSSYRSASATTSACPPPPVPTGLSCYQQSGFNQIVCTYNQPSGVAGGSIYIENQTNYSATESPTWGVGSYGFGAACSATYLVKIRACISGWNTNCSAYTSPVYPSLTTCY